MIPELHVEKIALPDGREIELQTGHLAKQADGSVVVKVNGTMLLGTVVARKEANEGVDFLPLTVDYREKYAAGGKIPGGFLKREARPSDEEVLTMRLVDRVLRPLFPKDYHCEVQVMIQLMSYDGSVNPDALAGLAASAALSLTDIPFAGPISEARVIRKDGNYIVNPTYQDMEGADLDIMVGASKDSVTMVEGEMNEISEKEMIEAIQFAHEEIKKQIEAQERLAQKAGAPTEVREYEQAEVDEALEKKVYDAAYQKCYEIAKSPSAKEERSDAYAELHESLLEGYSEEELEEVQDKIAKYFSNTKKEAIRNLILDEGIRLDGRGTTDIRPIWSMIDYLPGAHGSALFTRGETQSITTVTLGSSLDANRKDNVLSKHEEKFYLHYNFPPFSTGEARPIRGTSRREIGHGNLAQRALANQIPADNPFVVRIVSDILESNGSSSMATVCAGTLAMMDAGIKMIKPVSGIAMGLITDPESGRWKVLSDILGDEDFLGDMDFKVTGTKDGITACQMDIKIQGLTYDIMEKALEQAKDGRLHILGKMMETISEPRPQLKPHAPKIVTVEVPLDYIGAIIGPGGKVIQGIQAETETTIAIEEKDAHGIVEISGVNQEGMDEAVRRIKQIIWVPTIGDTYEATVKSIKPFGAFVEIAKGVEGLVHISEIDHKRIENVEDVLKEGQKVKVKYVENDKKTGKMRLSMKALIERPS